MPHPLMVDPGTRFGYSNLTAHMLAVILSRAANASPQNHRNLLHFANNSLFDPLGVEVKQWPRDLNGYYYGSGDITFTPRDMARFIASL